MSFVMTDRWKPERDLSSLCHFMRQPEIYWSIQDRLAPQPEQMDLEGWLLHQDCKTYVAQYDGLVIGYCQFVRRTSITVEMQVAYAKQFRGVPAKRLTMFAMADMFSAKGILKIISPIASDNRPSIFAARHIGMRKEGELTNAIVREGGVRNLLLFGITRDEFVKRGAT